MNSSEELYNRLIGTLSALVNVRHIAELKNWVWIVTPDLAGCGRNFAVRSDRLKQDRHAYTGRYSSRVGTHLLCTRTKPKSVFYNNG